MAAVSAAGEKLPPMIVFEGVHVQTTWRPDIPKTSNMYPWLYANKSGWMTSETFFKWFEEWEAKTRSVTEDGELEKRLLIFDGHSSHLWYGTIELARTQKVTIIKIPPHTTDLLQPLDVSVFKALKNYWGAILFKRNKLARSKLTKAEFSKYLCDPEVWDKAFSKSNIVNGFVTCGIHPVDRSRYPKNRFNVNLKARYDKWVEAGKLDISAEEIDEMLSEVRSGDTQDGKTEDSKTEENKENTAPSSAGPSTSATKEVVVDGKKGKIISFFVPDDNPSEMSRIETPTTTPNTTPNSSKGFKEVALKMIDDLDTPKSAKSTAEKEKRRRVNPFCELVTSDAKFQEVLAEEKQK